MPAKKIGFLSFGHWTPSPQSQVRTASDALLQSIDLAVAAEELGADGAYYRVHHFLATTRSNANSSSLASRPIWATAMLASTGAVVSGFLASRTYTPLSGESNGPKTLSIWSPPNKSPSMTWKWPDSYFNTPSWNNSSQ
jgi:hypothetical protein